MRDRHVYLTPTHCVPVPSIFRRSFMKRRRWNAIVNYSIAALVIASAIVGIADVIMVLES
jgi:hypothetical protein